MANEQQQPRKADKADKAEPKENNEERLKDIDEPASNEDTDKVKGGIDRKRNL